MFGCRLTARIAYPFSSRRHSAIRRVMSLRNAVRWAGEAGPGLIDTTILGVDLVVDLATIRPRCVGLMPHL